jgi:D-glycero-D-manno-heptose 1,7-bisphosphate phosphatase
MSARRGDGALVVLDRDGTVNALAFDDVSRTYESPYRSADVRLLPGVARGIARLTAAGAVCVVASNQPAADKGRASLSDLTEVHRKVDELLRAEGAFVRQYAYCVHAASRGCRCRKPEPGLLTELCRSIDPAGRRPHRFMIGDSFADVEAGQALAWRTILVETPESAHRRIGSARPDLSVPTTNAALSIVEGNLGGWTS